MSIDIRPLNRRTLQKSIETAVEIFEERERAVIEVEFKASLGIEPEDSMALDELKISDAQYFLATENGDPVGTGGYYFIDGHEDEAWLGWFGVVPKHLGKGYGSKIMSEAFNRAAQAGVKNLRLWTTTDDKYADACKLYKRMGFIEEVYKPNAKDAGKMILVYSKPVDPDATHDFSWAANAYEIDCEPMEIPVLNKKYGFTPDKAETKVSQRLRPKVSDLHP